MWSDVPAEAYARFMGVFSDPLSASFVDLLGAVPGERALDVGCGTGLLTARLVSLLGAGCVSAIDPSTPFVEATRVRFPEVDVRQGSAEDLPWDDDSFDRVGAQLVVHFMSDPVAGLREMLRVARPGGRVAACVWDHAGGRGPLSPFWSAARDLEPSLAGEDSSAGSREGDLVRLLSAAGGGDVAGGTLAVEVPYDGFATWWEPYTFGVGPAGVYVAGLDPDHRDALRERCRARLPSGSFTLRAVAWSVTASATS